VTRFAGGPSDSPGFLLWRATMRWQRALAAALAPLDLTHVQFVLLACAWWSTEAGDRPNQVQLAGLAGIDVKMTSEVVRRLEAKQLLRRVADPSDARSKVIEVTPAGADAARRSIEIVEAADAEFFAAAEEPRLVALLRSLGGVAG
jgi:DNA-binding MarR family transcriptional regulator